jgi:hypothetical protein
MERIGGRSQLTRDAGESHLSSLRAVAADESAPIAMSAWLFGRWIGIGVAGFRPASRRRS